MRHNPLSFVALEGFEPSQAEPESDVLPLHHKAIFPTAKVYCFFQMPNSFADYFLAAYPTAIYRFKL